MDGFEVLIQYRETRPETELIPYDEELVIVLLQGFQVKPVKVDSNERKLRYHFVKEEAEKAFQVIQKILAGLPVEEKDMTFDITALVLAMVSWRNWMAHIHARRKK